LATLADAEANIVGATVTALDAVGCAVVEGAGGKGVGVDGEQPSAMEAMTTALVHAGLRIHDGLELARPLNQGAKGEVWVGRKPRGKVLVVVCVHRPTPCRRAAWP
jgi:hypothetical protein